MANDTPETTELGFGASVSTVVAARIANDDLDALKRRAVDKSQTVGELLRGLIHRELQEATRPHETPP